jgi:hypothetical protein
MDLRCKTHSHKKQRNLISESDPEGGLVRRDPSSPMLGSLEAKASIFIIIIGHLVVILNFDLDLYFYSFHLQFSVHKFMMILFASIYE